MEFSSHHPAASAGGGPVPERGPGLRFARSCSNLDNRATPGSQAACQQRPFRASLCISPRFFGNANYLAVILKDACFQALTASQGRHLVLLRARLVAEWRLSAAGGQLRRGALVARRKGQEASLGLDGCSSAATPDSQKPPRTALSGFWRGLPWHSEREGRPGGDGPWPASG